MTAIDALKYDTASNAELFGIAQKTGNLGKGNNSLTSIAMPERSRFTDIYSNRASVSRQNWKRGKNSQERADCSTVPRQRAAEVGVQPLAVLGSTAIKLILTRKIAARLESAAGFERLLIF